MEIPEVIRVENGPQYSSLRFNKFAKDQGYQNIKSSPEYPSPIGLAAKTIHRQ